MKGVTQFGAPGVVVTLTVPAGSTLVGAAPGGVVTGHAVVWHLGNARAKSQGTAWIRVQPDGGLPHGTVLESIATLADATGLQRADTAQVVLWNYAHKVMAPIVARNGAP